VSPLSLGLVLTSAAMHASWNLLAKGSRNRLVAVWAQLGIGAVLFSPVLVALGGPPLSVWAWMVATGLVHMAYVLSLAEMYEHADLSLAYPLARGMSPLLITVGGMVLLGDRVGVAELAGVVLVVAALGVFTFGAGGSTAGVGWAVLTGLLITTYTLIDTSAVRHLDSSVAYTITQFLVETLLVTPVVLIRIDRGVIAGILRTEGRRLAIGGFLSVLAYVLVLAAARLSAVGPVSAIRETSVLFGALGGWLLLGEGLGPRRTLASAVMAGGIVVVALGAAGV